MEELDNTYQGNNLTLEEQRALKKLKKLIIMRLIFPRISGTIYGVYIVTNIALGFIMGMVLGMSTFDIQFTTMEILILASFPLFFLLSFIFRYLDGYTKYYAAKLGYDWLNDNGYLEKMKRKIDRLLEDG